jgi:hypothetical protein
MLAEYFSEFRVIHGERIAHRLEASVMLPQLGEGVAREKFLLRQLFML